MSWSWACSCVLRLFCYEDLCLYVCLLFWFFARLNVASESCSKSWLSALSSCLPCWVISVFQCLLCPSVPLSLVSCVVFVLSYFLFYFGVPWFLCGVLSITSCVSLPAIVSSLVCVRYSVFLCPSLVWWTLLLSHVIRHWVCFSTCKIWIMS